MSFYAPVLQVFDLKAGESVGYSASFVAPRDMKVAALSVGYADGLPWYLKKSKCGRVFFSDKSVPIIGSVCMDITMCDVSEIPDVVVGNMAEIMGAHISAEDLGNSSGTIGYEIFCRFGVGRRAEKIYKD
jgi:alanine racemase